MADDPAASRFSVRWLAVALVALSLGGCLTQVFYNRLDWLLGHEVSRYVDFTDAQRPLYERSVAELWRWHRHTELPVYAQELRALADAVAQPLSQDQAQHYAQRYVELFTRTLHQGAAPTCAVLATIDDAQVKSILDEAKADIDRYARDELNPGEAKARERAERKQLRAAKRWLGTVGPEQRDALHRWATQRPYFAPQWIEYRRVWKLHFEMALARRRAPDFCERIDALMSQPATLWSPALRAQVDQNEREWARLLSQISGSIDADQRAHLQREIRTMAADFETLAAQP